MKKVLCGLLGLASFSSYADTNNYKTCKLAEELSMRNEQVTLKITCIKGVEVITDVEGE